MSAHLEAVLDDLRAGLRNRAVRRRRARAAATGSATLVLLAAALAGGIGGFDRSSSALASASGTNDAALMLRGCQLLNLPKTAQEAPNTCVVP